MSFYRTLLVGLLLAVLGALAWQLLAPDLGDVQVSWHHWTMHTTVAFSLFAWALIWFVLVMLWWLLRIPFRAWRRLARKQARTRLVTGLAALQQGRWARAESLLLKASEEPEARTVALSAARDAALRRGDAIAAATHQSALASHDPSAAALNNADTLLAQNKAADALGVLQPYAEKNALSPRGLLLQAEALSASGRAQEAFERLPVLRNEQVLSAEELFALEVRLGANALRESPDADVLKQRWNDLPSRLRESAVVVAAYARRAAELGLEDDGARIVAEALDRQWDDTLVELYGQLPAGRDDRRLVRSEGWSSARPDNAALLLCQGRLCLTQQAWSKAEERLHRAIARGGGSDAWEALGRTYTALNNSSAAEVAYANALRTQRGETPLALSGRSLREQIASEAVAEQRNEHGLPLLPNL
jgi:HemY protein